MIKIALIEDDPELRESFVELIYGSEDIEIKGIYQSAEDFILDFGILDIDVAVMDIGLPGISGIECIARLKEEKPGVQYLVYTIFENDEKIYESICAGATGYIVKSTATEKIRVAIREIYAGGSPMTEQIARKVLQAFQKGLIQKPGKNEPLSLTPQEQSILVYMSKGYRYKEIAGLLFFNIETVQAHIRSIYEKLHVTSRTKAINKYLNITENIKIKYPGSYFKEEQLIEIVKKISLLFEKEKTFLDPCINISKLAEKLSVPAYALSQAINSRLKMNFFDFINSWRINESCDLLKKPESNNLTIESIAYDCGFGSKASFYNSFKKFKNCTPNEWKENSR